jgi:hypothetical protein
MHEISVNMLKGKRKGKREGKGRGEENYEAI